MSIVLKIEDDAEIRAFTKDLIRGQVRSIAREEVIAILKEELLKKTPEIDPTVVLKEEVLRLARNTLDRSSWNSPSFIQQVAREEINKILKEKLSV